MGLLGILIALGLLIWLAYRGWSILLLAPAAAILAAAWAGQPLLAHMRAAGRFSVATGVPVYFCDPHSPWQRGSNENTNGLLRQYFPKGTSLAGHSPADLAAVADELNGRPRKTLGWKTPAEALAEILDHDAAA